MGVDFTQQMKGVLDGYMARLDVNLETALDKCAQVYVSELEKNAPRSGQDAEGKSYHLSFAVNAKYNGRRYVGNTKTVAGENDKNIPLINLLEFGRGPERIGQRPHMNAALIATAERMTDIVTKEIEGG